MSPQPARTWTESDFETLSWHDNHIHGFHLSQGRYGTGELTFDVDFILEWVKSDQGMQFVMAPADLVFHEASELRVDIDYGAMSAGMGPFSIQGLERRFEDRGSYTAQIWSMEISFPTGTIEFAATGFTQRLRGPTVRSDQQVLSREERGDG